MRSTTILLPGTDNSLLSDQGNNILKSLLKNIPTCHRSTPQDVCTWYHFFVTHSTFCGYHVHLYYCCQKSADLLYGFRCGNDATAVFTTPVSQHDLSGHFLPKMERIDTAIYNTIRKYKIFQKGSVQQQIVEQNYFKCYKNLSTISLLLIIQSIHPLPSALG